MRGLRKARLTSARVGSCGFTLLELMVVIVMIAILTALAWPTYQQYVARSAVSQAQQDAQRVATLLDSHRLRSLSYRGFDWAGRPEFGGSVFSGDNKLYIPQGTGATNYRYLLELTDGDAGSALTNPSSLGHAWAVTMVRNPALNAAYYPNMVLTSRGERCGVIGTATATNVSFQGCSAGASRW